MKIATLVLIMLIFKTYKADILDAPRDSEPSLAIYEKGNRYFYFPGDGDQKIYLVDSEALVLMPKSREAGNGNSYWLSTRKNMNEYQELIMYNEDSITKSNFDVSKTTVFIVHGWKGNCNNTICKLLSSAFLEDDDVNAIVVDYSADASLLYLLAQSAAVDVGIHIGKFIYWMHTLGMSYNKVHLVGFSLGAHVVGMAGRYNNGTVRRITALDPAGPLWYDNKYRLTQTDANYVEVIHTNMLFYGYDGKLGDADFYPNGGVFMPECNTNACSHSIAYHYMAQSVVYNNFISNECKNFNEASINLCNGRKYPMGNSDYNKNRTGMFRVDTERGKKLEGTFR